MSSGQSFQANIRKQGARAFIPIPFEPDTAWGAKSRHSVTGTVNGKAIRGALAAFDQSFGLPVGPVWLRDNGLQVGDKVAVELRPEGPQLDTVGEDLAGALKAHPRALEFFESLPTFHRKNYIRWIDDAKRPETRARRIAEAINLLENGVRR